MVVQDDPLYSCVVFNLVDPSPHQTTPAVSVPAPPPSCLTEGNAPPVEKPDPLYSST